MKNEKKCSNCGAKNCNLILTEDTKKYYCKECVNELASCEDCGAVFENSDNLFYLDNLDISVCSDCLNNDYSECDCCHNYVLDNEMHDINNGDLWYCEKCVSNYCCHCNNCGELFDNDNLNEFHENYYCDSCYEEINFCEEEIYDYHDFNDWQFLETEEEKEEKIFGGIELEVECSNYYNMSSGVNEVYSKLPAVCMHDNSIDNGFEIVTHPMTLHYLYTHEEDFKNTFKRLQELEFKSHDTTTCGLHVHISRPSEEVIDKIWLFLETYKDELIKFSRRDINRLHEWASFLSDKYSEEILPKSIDFIKKCKGNVNRYVALNLTNTDTIEFRLFKGTLNFDTFMACVELCFSIVKQCQENVSIENISWNSVINFGKYLKNYCIEKNILTDKKMKDMSIYKISFDNFIKNESAKLKRYFKKNLKIEFNRIIEDIYEFRNAKDIDFQKLDRNINYMNILRRLFDIFDYNFWEKEDFILKFEDYTYFGNYNEEFQNKIKNYVLKIEKEIESERGKLKCV